MSNLGDASVDVSVVIPARNEEAEIARCLDSVFEALDHCQLVGEVIVVNDGSDDRTAEIAEGLGARVIHVELHNIGAVRNAGAETAVGHTLVFLDADTQLPERTLQSALAAIADGAVGGGCGIVWDSKPPLASRVCAKLFLFVWQGLLRYACGCFIFCRRDAFEAVGGFDSTWFAAEERQLTQVLRKRGRFIILKEHVISSARKMRIYSTGELLGIAVPALFLGKNRLQRRRGLELLYDAPREAVNESRETVSDDGKTVGKALVGTNETSEAGS